MSNLVIVKDSPNADGTIKLYNDSAGRVDLVVDLLGYVKAGSVNFVEPTSAATRRSHT